MSIREEFVLKAREEGANLSALSQSYGISRKTAYKWLERYKTEGVRGLADMSRRPSSNSLATTPEVVAEVVAFRLAHPHWGPKKLAVLVRDRYPKTPPSIRTVARILVRAGLVGPARRRRRRPEAHFGPPEVKPQAPNDLWTVDFKGWWLTKQRERCEPLTVRDAYSRYVLGIIVLNSPQTEPVMTAFKDLFRRFGVPKAVLTDGGPPFVTAHGQLGLTQLSAWWLSLGIEHYRSRPATPSDNGGHERMHRDMAAELERFAALHLAAQQAACDRWRHEFNHERPHEALGMKMPGQVYHRSDQPFDDKDVELDYPEHFLDRVVSRTGHLRLQRKDMFLSWALAGRRVGFEPLGAARYNVWFSHRKLGEVDLSQPKAIFTASPWNQKPIAESAPEAAPPDVTNPTKEKVA